MCYHSDQRSEAYIEHLQAYKDDKGFYKAKAYSEDPSWNTDAMQQYLEEYYLLEIRFKIFKEITETEKSLMQHDLSHPGQKCPWESDKSVTQLVP